MEEQVGVGLEGGEGGGVKVGEGGFGQVGGDVLVLGEVGGVGGGEAEGGVEVAEQFGDAGE